MHYWILLVWLRVGNISAPTITEISTHFESQQACEVVRSNIVGRYHAMRGMCVEVWKR